MNPPKHKIRSAEFKDVESVFKLIKQHPDNLLARSINDIVQNIDRCMVCEIQGKIEGTISWQILPEIGRIINPSVEIKSLSVDENHHGKGMGTELVQQVIEHIKTIAPSQIIVLTFTPEFFSKLGFKKVEKETLMHKIYLGCINCPKHESPFTCPETAMTMKL